MFVFNLAYLVVKLFQLWEVQSKTLWTCSSRTFFFIGVGVDQFRFSWPMAIAND